MRYLRRVVLDIGLVFPGQGSQFVGMGKFLYENFPVAKHTFEEASDTLSLNFKKLCFEGPESDLTLTSNTQPALLVASIALDRVLKKVIPLKPRLAAGHSLGEYSALVSAEAISFLEALRAVRLRGEFMQDAVPVGNGAMLVVMGLNPDEVITLCEWVCRESALGPLSPANYNAPGQIVISGTSAATEWLKTNFSAERSGINSRPKFIALKVSAPFHCSLMKPAQDKMGPVLQNMSFSEPIFPIVQNVTALATDLPQELRKNLIAQVSAPVKWMQSVAVMADAQITKLIEVGPGKVLAGLVKKIDSERLTTINVLSLEDIHALEKQFT